MNEIWKPIADYPTYEVSNCGRVRHLLKNGKIKMLKLSGRKVHLHKNKERITVSIGKLMYATFHNIELYRLTNIVVVGNTLENIRITTADDFLNEIRSKSHIKFSPELVEKFQIESFEDIRTVLDVWATGDSSNLFLRVEGYKKDQVAYFRKRFELSAKTAEELWSQARDLLIFTILNKQRSVSGFQGWLKVTIKHLYYQRRDKRKLEIPFNENTFSLY